MARSTYYNTLHYGGSECTTERAYVMIYPNTSYEEDHFLNASDDIPSAIDGALSQLESASAISYYSVDLLDTSECNYPDLQDISNSDDIRTKFQNYLTTPSKNGSGTNLKDQYGLHLFVHSNGCTENIAGGEVADKGCYTDTDGDGDYDSSAFSRGVMGWTGAECQLSSGLRKNSAIQETIHGFIRYNAIDYETLCGDSGSPNLYNEHRLGESRYGTVSPLLTYHADEDDQYHQGKCDGVGSTRQDSYTQTLTDCTVTAVDQTTNSICVSQNKPSWCDNVQTANND